MFKKAEYIAAIDKSNPIAKSHILHGERVLPGVVYLEICMNLLGNEGYDVRCISFSNIMFFTPLKANCQKELIFNIDEYNNEWCIIAKSREINSQSDNAFVKHFECNIEFTGEDEETIDPEKIMSQAEGVVDIDDAYKFVRMAGIVHKGYMKPLGKVYLLKDAILGHIYFEEENDAESQIVMRAAVFDSSTVLPYLAMDKNRQNDFGNKAFIPLHIDKFRTNASIPTEAYIYVKKDDVFLADNGDYCYASWRIFDSAGNLTNHFSKLSSKQIRIDGSATVNSQFFIENEKNQDDDSIIKEDKTDASNNKILSDNFDTVKYLASKIEKTGKIKLTHDDYEIGFYELGLNSKDLISTVKEIEHDLGCKLYPTIMFEYPDINSFSEYLENYINIDKEIGNNGEKLLSETCKSVTGTTGSSDINVMPIEYTVGWHREELGIQPEFDKYDRTIYISDNTAFTDFISKSSDAVVLTPAKGYRKISGHAFCIRPYVSDDIVHVLSEIGYSGKNIAIVTCMDAGELEKYSEIGEEQRVYVHNLAIAKGIIDSKDNKANYNILAIGCSNSVKSSYTSALGGLYRCFIKEKKKVTASIINIEDMHSPDEIMNIIKNELYNKNHFGVQEILYKHSKRYIKGICKSNFNSDNHLKENGIYIITGGYGKICKMFIENEIKHNNSRFILLGKSAHTDEKQQWLESVNKYKAKVEYYSVDICNDYEVKNVMDIIMDKYKKITGIFHAAGMIEDELIINKNYAAKSDRVIECKIKGLFNVLSGLRTGSIDFLLHFSSISAAFGNEGQANYAYANAFLDNCVYFNTYSNIKNVISVDWPVWENGGMKFGYDEKAILNETGLGLINEKVGVSYISSVSKERNSQKIFVMAEENKFISGLSEIYPIFDELDGINAEERLTDNYADNDIAIIGMDARFPQANNIEEFWDNLKNGKDCIINVPETRWTKQDIKNLAGNHDYDVCDFGGFLDNIDEFDTRLFHITPMEAKNMDPQERLFLSSVWNLLEDSGYSKKNLENNNIGVFACAMWGHYQMCESVIDGQKTLPSSIYASIANRVSYFFDWHGPSLTLDTMCSSTITAIKYACDSLINNDCKMAVAGGVNLSIHPAKYIVLAQNNFTAKDGRCRSFGAGGQGYVPGEGAGTFMLKKAKDAINDGDHIYGIIKSCVINHGGKTSGYSVPNAAMQANVIRAAIDKANIRVDDISYIEAHGTGTALGDPIEIRALQSVFERETSRKQFCSIGSVKSNIGHLEAAACVASLVKVLLQMKYKKLVPSLHSNKTNPNINFSDTPFYCQQDYADWNSNNIRTAGISAFGAGGSNGHLIVQEYIERKKAQNLDRNKNFLFVYSADDKTVLNKLADRHLDFLKRTKNEIYISLKQKDIVSKEKIISDMLTCLDISKNKSIEEVHFFELGIDQYGLFSFVSKLEEIGYKIPEISEIINIGKIQKIVDILYELNTVMNEEIICEDSTDRKNKELEFLERYSYTLQTGRVHMNYRISVIADSIDGIISGLRAYIDGTNDRNVFSGDTVQKDNSLAKMMKSENGIRYLESLVMSNELISISELWCRGIEIDWKSMRHCKVQKISAPGYPFRDETIERAKIRKTAVVSEEAEEEDISGIESDEEIDLFSIIAKIKTGEISIDRAKKLLI
jgi:3-oxoacyl-(acyl-carrier-protein) synthase